MPQRRTVKSQIIGWSVVLFCLGGVLGGITAWQMRHPARARNPVEPNRPSQPAGQPVPASAPSANETTAKTTDFTALAGMDDHAKFLRLMNLAKAYLEKGEHQRAIEMLAEALRLRPSCPQALRNLARAYLFSGQPDASLPPLQQARTGQSDSVATAYLTGLALAQLDRNDEALRYFQQAARLDANSAATRFQLATAYQALGQQEKAREQLEETIRLDPQHSAAQFQLAMLAREAGDTEQSRRYMQEFIRLRDAFGDPPDSPLALAACRYTAAEPPPRDQVAAKPPTTVKLTDATDALLAQPADRAASAVAILDMDEYGRYTLLVAGPDGKLSLMSLSPTGKMQRKPLALKLPELGGIQACIVGNFSDEPPEGQADSFSVSGLFADVLIVGREQLLLLLRTGPDQFQDVTQAAGLAGASGNAARWVDWECDGDLDLLLATQTGLQLWQNAGNGTFREVSAEVGMPNQLDCTAIDAADLDANGAVDFIAACGTKPTQVFLNQRAGRMAPMPEPPGPWPAARHVLANDFSNNGRVDVVLVGQDRVTFMLGQTPDRQPIAGGDFIFDATILLDYDNDGWLDFCAAGHRRQHPDQGRLRLWRNEGDGTWRDLTAPCQLDTITSPPVRDLVAADLDADGDTDLLLLTASDTLRWLRNDGGNVNGQLKVRLCSLLISNRGGIGTQIEVRDGDYLATRSVQQQWPVEIGLDGHSRLDAVRAVWPDGVVRTRTAIDSVKQPLDFVVTEFVATGSCPYLYVWDGRGFRFVTDLLGGGALGVPVSRDELEPVNPHELVLIGDQDRFRPNRGEYTIKVSNEQRETDYLDGFRLLAVDHPRDVEIHSSDMLRPPPFPPSRVRGLSNAIAPRRAEGDDGSDRTEQVRALDGHFSPPGPALPAPLPGVCRPMSLTLDFGPIDADRALVLALTGWTQYGTSSSNIALSQNPSVRIMRPRLEAETADGQWITLDVVLGIPAGKTKTILCDLEGKLPGGTKRLRLTTTHEIRWDRIALCESRRLDASRIHRLVPCRAALDWRGFSEIRSRAPGHPSTPAYADVAERPPWYTALQGWHTRYGDVTPLVTEADGQLVLLNGGDVLTVQWRSADLPPVPRGMVRTFLLDCEGWNKEGDPNTVGGDRVEPLPGADRSPDAADWPLRYNTRWVPRDCFDPRW